MTSLGHFRSLTSQLFPSDVRRLFVLWKKASLMLATAIIINVAICCVFTLRDGKHRKLMLLICCSWNRQQLPAGPEQRGARDPGPIDRPLLLHNNQLAPVFPYFPHCVICLPQKCSSPVTGSPSRCSSV